MIVADTLAPHNRQGICNYQDEPRMMPWLCSIFIALQTFNKLKSAKKYRGWEHRWFLGKQRVCTITALTHNVAHHGSLQWRQNEGDGISNHRHLDGLLNRLFRRGSKKTSKLVENVSKRWRRHVILQKSPFLWYLLLEQVPIMCPYDSWVWNLIVWQSPPPTPPPQHKKTQQKRNSNKSTPNTIVSHQLLDTCCFYHTQPLAFEH